MNLNITGTDKLKIFFSYSTTDKKIVGLLKDPLELYGFEVFVAHDDDAIEPAVEWQYVIIDNLKKCDIFIPLITNNFKESNWTDQETGMAKISGKFIIPLEVDDHPYGFIGNIQSLKLDRNKLTSKNSIEFETYVKYDLPIKIFKIIEKVPIFEKYMVDIFIKELGFIGSFATANEHVKLIDHFNNFTPEQINQIYQITYENRQIHDANVAQKVLKNFFERIGKYKRISISCS
ncbi:MAG: toll/interleukin-1 receptor domain-containing protein [Euryarchaeota archaeon]|nr:toll/interleukin-1 receptor domain-containing protein [Euryarchaeota archaeon]